LFPEAALPLRVIQPRSLEAIDKAINHVDAPCMIGVVSAAPHCDAFHRFLFKLAIIPCQVHVYQRTNDSHHTIASVGTMAKVCILFMQTLFSI
jgi:cereblon